MYRLKEKALFSDGEIPGITLHIINRPSNLPIVAHKLLKKYKRQYSDNTLKSKYYSDNMLITSDVLDYDTLYGISKQISNDLETHDIVVYRISER